MSIVSMHKKCTNCGKEFSYNPSVGDFGKICPKCGFPQGMTEKMPPAKKKSGVCVFRPSEEKSED